MDKFILYEKDYKKKIKLEKEKEERKDLIYHPKPFKKDIYHFNCRFQFNHFLSQGGNKQN